ncbi:MAG TPA: ABC transporter substrate-binding protein, partial [Candidatus Binatia bacterium]|nr:ABC transporter substrate-binding protein [Candidatus Binatia bacterium]
MSTVIIRSAFSCLLLASLVLASVCAPPFLNAQIKSNLSSSVTSESMTAVWVAREHGLFKKHGLDMQFILMPRNPLAVAALIAGEIDAAIIGPGHLVNAGLGGADVIGSANFHQKLDFGSTRGPTSRKQRNFGASGSP